MNLVPDALTGALMAIEGITDARAVLNSPTGCKFYHGHIADKQYPRDSSYDPLQYQEKFFFGQPRIPCTYLDEDDYVAGSTEKLKSILPDIAKKSGKLIVVVNSPGASLIGDDLKRFMTEAGLQDRCIAIESTGFSCPVTTGFEDAVLRMLEWMDIQPLPCVHNKVNLVGISILHKNWEGSVSELKRLLALMGLEVGSVLVAGSSVDEIRRSSDAACNIVVCSEYGLGIGRWYEEKFGIPMAVSPEGAPVGYEATEAWIRTIAEVLGIDPSVALEEVRKERKKVHRKIARFHSLTGLPKGASFALKADSSLALPLTKCLYYYLGMVPVAVNVCPGGDIEQEQMLKEFLTRIDFQNAWDNFPGEEPADIVIADGHTVGLMREWGQCRDGVEISLPSEGRLEFLSRTHMGTEGMLFLLEGILNGLKALP